MEANGISLFDEEPGQKKDRTKLLLGAVAAFGVVAALGTGFVLGGHGGNFGGVAGATKEQQRAAQVSPTANAGLGVVFEHGSVGGSTVGDTTGGDTTSGGPSSGGTTAPTSTPKPPAPTSTAVPPTSTSTATATATATAIVPTPTSTPVLPAPPLPPSRHVRGASIRARSSSTRASSCTWTSRRPQ